MTTISYIERGDARNGIARREVRLTGSLPKKVEKAGIRLMETEAARVTSYAIVEEAKVALDSAKAVAKHLAATEATADPKEMLRRLEAGEESTSEVTTKAAKKALKRAEETRDAFELATLNAYVELMATIHSEREGWLAQAGKDLASAVYELAPMLSKLNEVAAKVKDASTVFVMYERLADAEEYDDNGNELAPVAVMGADVKHPLQHTADIDKALAYLRVAVGGASHYMRQVPDAEE